MDHERRPTGRLPFEPELVDSHWAPSPPPEPPAGQQPRPDATPPLRPAQAVELLDFDERKRESVVNHLTRRLEKLGYRVALEVAPLPA